MRISDWSSDVCSSDLGWRTSSCAASVPAVHEADEDLLKRTLAGIEVLEVDAVRGQPAQQVGDAGFLGLGVEGVDKRLAIVGQLERQRGQLVGYALERRWQRKGQWLTAEPAHQRVL